MTFLPNPKFRETLEATQEYRDGLEEAAQPAADRAKDYAPVDEGDYRDSIQIVKVDVPMRTGRRVVEGGVYITATDFKAHWIEHGTAKTAPQAPLRKGAMAAGLEITENE